MNRKNIIALVGTAIFLAFLGVAGYLIYKHGINADVSIMVVNPNDASYAQSTGMTKINDGQLPILSIEGNKKDDTEQSINFNGARSMLDSGAALAFPVPGGMTSYVDKDPNIKILSSDTRINALSEKISPDLMEQVNKEKNISVIVELKNVEEGFTSSDSASDNKKVINQTAEAGKKIDKLIGKHGDVKEEMPIISSVSAVVDREGLEKLAASSEVEKVVKNEKVGLQLDSSPYQIGADLAWATVVSGSPLRGDGIKIAIIDTGIDYTHPDLGGCFGPTCKVVGGYDFYNNDNDPKDDNGHGTHVAATAAGKGSFNGIAPNAQIYAYKVLSSSGSALFSTIIQGIERTSDPNGDGDTSDHVDIASMSLGGSGDANDPASIAVDKVNALGVTVIVAAGNSGPYNGTVGSPGTARSAITVAASCNPTQMADPENQNCYNQKIAQFSSRGPVSVGGDDLKKPDISAPGVSICAAWPGGISPPGPTCFDNNHIRISGTSMATPHVAGAAALIKQANPNFTPAMIKEALKNTATNLGVDYDSQGTGLVNVKAAVGKDSVVKSNPEALNLESDPSEKIFSKNSVIAINSADNAITNLSAELQFDSKPGVSLALNENSIPISAGNGSLSLTATVDNDMAVPTVYQGLILLKNGAELVGMIPIKISVKPTLELSKQAMDFGINNPGNSSWTSEKIEVQIKNNRKDISKTVSISSKFPSGIQLKAFKNTGEEITNIILDKESQVPVSLQLSISSNSSFSNKAYQYNIEFSDQQNATLSLTGKFSKYYFLNIQNITGNKVGQDIEAQYLNIFDYTNKYAYSKKIKAGENKILLESSGPYDIGAISFEDFNYQNYFFFSLYENVNNGSNLNVDLVAAAKNRMSVNFKDRNGQTLSMYGSEHEIADKDGNSFYGMMGGTPPTAGNIFISNLSDRFFFKVSGGEKQLTKDKITEVSFSQNNITSDVAFEPKPEEFNSFSFTFPFSDLVEGYTPLLFSPCAGAHAAFWDSGGANKKWESLTFDSNAPAGYYQYLISNDLSWDNPCNNNPEDPICRTVFMTPRINFKTKTAVLDAKYFGEPLEEFSYPTNTLAVGNGPQAWAGKFDNWEKRVIVINTAFYPARVNAFLRQGKVKQYLPAQPYQILSDGKLVTEGSLPSDNIYGNGAFRLIYLPVNEGKKYQFKLSDAKHYIAGIEVIDKVTADFDLGKDDPDPPYIKDLTLTSEGKIQETLSADNPANLSITVDPDKGNIKNITLGYLANGTDQTSIPLVAGANQTYAADVSSSINNNLSQGKVTYALNITDDSDNRLNYQFQIPIMTQPEIEEFAIAKGYSRVKSNVKASVKNGATYSWSQKSGPGELRIENGSTVEAAFLAEVPGEYTVEFKSMNGTKAASKEFKLIIHKSGDINNDGKVDSDDFTLMMFNWAGIKNKMADLNGDGKVNNDDFTILLFWYKR